MRFNSSTPQAIGGRIGGGGGWVAWDYGKVWTWLTMAFPSRKDCRVLTPLGGIGLRLTDSLYQFRTAMRPGQRCALLDIAEGWLEDLLDTAKRTYTPKLNFPFGSSSISSDPRKRATEASRRKSKSERLLALVNLYNS